MRTRLTAVAAVSLICAGCASSSLPGGLFDALVVRQADQVMDRFLPASCRMVHKLRLRGGSREAVLTGHLILERRIGFRAVAVDEFGGPVFGFTVCPDGAVVDLAPRKTSEDILRRGPMRDLDLAFLQPATAPVATRADGAISVVVWKDGDRRIERDFDLARHVLVGLREWEGRRLQREIHFEYGGAVDLPGQGMKITIDNRALHYSIDIEILKLLPFDGTLQDRPLAHENWCKT